MNAIDGKGWFVLTISCLAAGDVRFIQKENPMSSKGLLEVFKLCDEHGFGRASRKNWMTMEHPDLGLLQWKQGTVPTRAGGLYLRVRLNGKEILRCQPLESDYSPAKWVAPAARPGVTLKFEAFQDGEAFLGDLENGSRITLAEWCTPMTPLFSGYRDSPERFCLT